MKVLPVPENMKKDVLDYYSYHFDKVTGMRLIQYWDKENECEAEFVVVHLTDKIGDKLTSACLYLTGKNGQYISELDWCDREDEREMVKSIIEW